MVTSHGLAAARPKIAGSSARQDEIGLACSRAFQNEKRCDYRFARDDSARASISEGILKNLMNQRRRHALNSVMRAGVASDAIKELTGAAKTGLKTQARARR
jgi:hypothetical protein